MKKNKKIQVILGIIFSIIVISSIVAFGFGDGLRGLSISEASSFTPIFCNDYEFSCCNLKEDSFIRQSSITDEIPYMCPLYASKCELGSDNIKVGTSIYIGSNNCRLEESFLGDRWECSDEFASDRKTLFPGEYAWVMNSLTKTFNVGGVVINDISVKIDRLDFCGRSGCSTGVPVSGADQCKFNPELNTIYTSTSSLTGKVNTASYTVPEGSCVLAFQSGDRHICGYKEESCSSDSDCNGHTFGNVECNGRTKQTYGCRSFGTPFSEKDRGPFDAGWGNDESIPNIGEGDFGKRCEIISSVQVQCCGDNDCGSDQFCDTSSFTCEEDVICTQDYQCGVSVQCDFSTKKLKKPICSIGKCSFDEVSVECCNNQQCSSGDFCNEERKCEERVIDQKECPFECCEDEDRYFDRLCSDSKPFCISGECSSKPPVEDKCESCDEFVRNTLFGSFIISQNCERDLVALPPQTNSFCVFSWLKISLSPIVFIFLTLFGINFFETSKQLKIKNKGLRIFVSILIAGILATLVYVTFLVGIILSIIALILIIILKAVL